MKYRHRVLAFLFSLSIITYLDRVCISVAGSRMEADLGLSAKQWGWVLGSFALAYAIFELPSGALGDRIGPRRVLTRIVLWWSAFTSLTGLARGFSSLLALRFLFGAGEAGAYPNGAATIARWFPARENARAQSINWMGGRVGGAVTPLLVVPVMLHFGWRTAFFVFGLLGALWAAVWYVWFRDSPAEKAGVSAAEMEEIGEAGRRREADGPVPWRRIFSQPNLWWIMLMYHTYCWLGYFFLSWMHTFLVQARGYSPQDLVKFTWMPFVLGAITCPLGGWVSDALARRIGLKWGRRLVGIAGLGLSAVCMLAATQTRDKTFTVVWIGLALGACDFMLPAAWAVCLDIAGIHAGTVSAAMNSAGQVGSFLTAVAFGYLVSATGSYEAPLYLMAGMAAISALLWLKIDPTLPILAERVDPAAA